MRTLTELAPNGAHSPNLSAGQRAIGPSKWSLLQAIEDIREPLGLKSTSISLLRAMISFIRGDHITASREDGHICFASNATLAKRTHVSVKTVERHISKLVSLGLVSRRSSTNGKRWARRDTSGRIVLATGLSLVPLIERQPEFIQLHQAHKEKLTNLSILRDKCKIALAKLKTYLPKRSDLEELFNSAKNLLRRRAPQEALETLLDEINTEIQDVSCEKADNLRGSEPENEGHKEPYLNRSVEKEDSSTIDVNQTTVEQAYPKLCAELRTARNQTECERRMGDIANHLALGNLWLEIKKLGPTKTFITLGYILERIEIIRKPKGYAFHLLQGLNSGNIAWHTMLKPHKPTKYKLSGPHRDEKFLRE